MKDQKFYNINHVINANAIELTTGDPWILWSLACIRKGVSVRRLNVIAEIVTK